MLLRLTTRTIPSCCLLLAAEIRKLGGSEERKRKLTERATALGKVVLPAFAKGLVRGVTTFIVGETVTDSIAESLSNAMEAADDGAGESLGKAIENRLDELQERTNTVAAFKEALEQWAGADEGPIVIFVDELDRCRPSFAVQLLERAKHFFEVPNVVFVLLLNKPQLEAAIKGVYGSGIDAVTYLTKFITLTVTLPKRITTGAQGTDFLGRYAFAVGTRLGYTPSREFSDFATR